MTPLYRLADELRQRRLGIRQVIVLEFPAGRCGHSEKHWDSKYHRCKLCVSINRRARMAASAALQTGRVGR